MGNLMMVYKCRLCGKEYSNIICPKSTAIFITENLCVSEEVTIHGMRAKRYDLHICKQGKDELESDDFKNLGFADFIGIRESNE